MHPQIRVFRLAFVTAAFLAPAMAAAQAPPKPPTPVAPKTEQLESRACANADTRTTVGQGGDLQAQNPSNKSLSDKLARSDGVICPPEHVDSEIKAPTPPGGAMPVIPPPGSPGGDPTIRPK
jgi:hypothetical protein